jgi:hypothetical protein
VWYDGSDEYLESIYQSTNAVLFPGGGQHLDDSQLLHTAEFFVNKASTGKDWYPVFGHCQGFEVLLMAITGLNRSQCMTNDLSYKAENVSLPLTFVETSSRWFATMPDSVQATLTQTNSTLNNHMWSIAPSSFSALQQKGLLAEFRVLSTSVSPGGKEFVSTFEGTTMPLYAMQFHAEKPIFEWPNEQINHSRDNVAAMSYFSHFVGVEASKNSHAFSSKKAEQDSLIYNYAPVPSIGFSTFEQVYFFPKQS